MKRRELLGLGFGYAFSTLGASALSGCGGGGDGGGGGNPVTPVAKCSTGTFSLGLNFASADTMAKIAPSSATGASAQALTSSTTSAIKLPAYFSLADYALMADYGWSADFLPRPGNQGKLGSCVAWGAGYAMGSFHNALQKRGSAQTSSSQLSPADLYAKLLRREAGNICRNGTVVKDALDIMVQEGVASLATSPYADSACVLPSTNSLFFLDGYHRISVQDSVAIKTELNNFNVLPFGMTVYSDFEQLQGTSIYAHSRSDTSCPIGGHCMAIVGYDDGKSAYRIMNSWGGSWCDQGFTWIDYETFGRVVSEVYAPYAHQTSQRSALVASGTNTSGGISAVSALAYPWLDSSTQRYDTMVFFFQLSDWMYVSYYRIRAISTTSVSSEIYSASLGQVLRGSYFEATLGGHGDAPALAATKYFALDLTGQSRTSQSVALTLFSQYPVLGSR